MPGEGLWSGGRRWWGEGVAGVGGEQESAEQFQSSSLQNPLQLCPDRERKVVRRVTESQQLY